MLHEARRGQVDQQLAHEIVNGAAFPPATRPAGAAESDERCNVPTYRKGRELALEEANGATFPPMAGPGARALGGQQCNVSTYGRAGSPCLGKPTVQYSHLRRGQQALLIATNGTAFPPTAGPGAGALGGQRCSVPTYGRAGSRCPGRPTVQRFHLRPGREPVPWAANGAAFPPMVGPGAGALGGQRCSVPTYGRAGSRCPGRPTVQGSRGPDEGGGGDKAYQQCRISTDPEEDSRSRHN